MQPDETARKPIMTSQDLAPASTAMAADAYLRVRRLEGRVLPDDLVARLPNLPITHPLYTEWRLRGESAERSSATLRAGPGRNVSSTSAAETAGLRT